MKDPILETERRIVDAPRTQVASRQNPADPAWMPAPVARFQGRRTRRESPSRAQNGMSRRDAVSATALSGACAGGDRDAR